jgi:ComF family protein
VCAVPLASEHSGVCGECLQKPPPFSIVLNYGLYSGALSEAINLLKFQGVRRLAGPLGELLTGLPIPYMDGIVPVPVTAKTLRERGFNQTLLVAKSLSGHLHIPLKIDVLSKTNETRPQIGLGAVERAVNLKNSFSVKDRLNGSRLLLLDDVMTTGATARECARALMKAGGGEVVVITLARSALT